MYTGEFFSKKRDYIGEIYTGEFQPRAQRIFWERGWREFTFGKFSRGVFSAVEFNKGRIFCAVEPLRGVLHGGNIREPLYKCGWFIRFGRLDNLVKYAFLVKFL